MVHGNKTQGKAEEALVTQYFWRLLPDDGPFSHLAACEAEDIFGVDGGGSRGCPSDLRGHDSEER